MIWLGVRTWKRERRKRNLIELSLKISYVDKVLQFRNQNSFSTLEIVYAAVRSRSLAWIVRSREREIFLYSVINTLSPPPPLLLPSYLQTTVLHPRFECLYLASNVLLHMNASLNNNSVFPSFQSFVGKLCKNMIILCTLPTPSSASPSQEGRWEWETYLEIHRS